MPLLQLCLQFYTHNILALLEESATKILQGQFGLVKLSILLETTTFRAECVVFRLSAAQLTQGLLAWHPAE